MAIPVYTAEGYLRPCLDSVLGQTLRDIEVICVDDGSMNGSTAILTEYSVKDACVQVVSQTSCSQCPVRDRGLERAVGEDVYFIDTDDELASANALERLVCEADSGQLDAFFFDAGTKVDAGFDGGKASVNPRDYVRSGNNFGIYDESELFARFLERNEHCVCLCLTTFCREFLPESLLAFAVAGSVRL